MRIIIGTKNQKKIDVVSKIFQEVLNTSNVEVVAHDAKSLVSEAPHNKETYDGALNRARECQVLGAADYYVGIESGLTSRYGNFFEEAWAVIISKDDVKLIGYSSGLLLPEIVVKRMENGQAHNQIMSDFDKEFNLLDDNRDTWSRYTGGYISRQVSLEEALRNALIQNVSTKQNLYNYK